MLVKSTRNAVLNSNNHVSTWKYHKTYEETIWHAKETADIRKQRIHIVKLSDTEHKIKFNVLKENS